MIIGVSQNDASLHVHRTEDLERLHNLTSQSNVVLVLGQPGVGKTDLVRDYQHSYSNYYGRTYFLINSKHLPVDELWLSITVASEDEPVLICIDNPEDAETATEQSVLLKLIRNARSFHVKFILASRGTDPRMRPFLTEGLTMRLYVLQEKEIKELVNKFFDWNSPAERSRELYMQLALGKDSTTEIHRLLEEAIQNAERRSLIQAANNLMADEFSYSNQPITEAEVRKDIRIVNTRMIELVKKDPSFLLHLNSRKFEELIAEMFTKKGYEVTLTSQTRDGGIDMYVIQHHVFGKMLYLVECKQFTPPSRVGVRVVRELHGVVNHERANAGMIITTSHFTKPAIDFRQTIEHQMHLIDFERLSKIIKEID